MDIQAEKIGLSRPRIGLYLSKRSNEFFTGFFSEPA